ncbi:uncharacterized protein LOC135463492 [Liolophura sinensis]|uniref:uncharacterized protein LOC135463492 n=1 Tax=Liolophura sinensis TaxID=3198878 RepID=UPI003157F86C
MAALKEFGICYLKNHGISPEKTKTLFDLTREVFALPTEVKMRMSRRLDALYHGYCTREIERPKDVTSVERYETFMTCPRQAFAWPDEVPAFKPASLDVFYEFEELSFRVFDVLAVGLGLQDRGFLRRSHMEDSGDLRNSLYHSYPDDFVPKPQQVRYMEHYDVGTVSFVYQRDVGGLEIQTKSGKWIGVPCIPGTVLLLTGKLMERWTSDRLKAVFHRVAIPEDQASRRKDRQSLSFFPLTADDFEFRCLDGSNKYDPITLRDYCAKNILKGEYVDV